MAKTLYFFILMAFLVTPQHATATVRVNAETSVAHWNEVLQTKQQELMQKDAKSARKLAKWQRRLEKKWLGHTAQVDFEDPTERWLWFGLFGLGLGLVMSLFSGPAAGLLGLLGVICLVIWVLKKTGSMSA
ncbi:MAG: hypothetical protein IT269_02300 [Saprospiraceae bacterium]|nr:hypothetical protein [Saprospiraceae bacterium]